VTVPVYPWAFSCGGAVCPRIIATPVSIDQLLVLHKCMPCESLVKHTSYKILCWNYSI